MVRGININMADYEAKISHHNEKNIYLINYINSNIVQLLTQMVQ